MARYQYPSDTNNHPVWVRIAITKRVTVAQTDFDSETKVVPADEIYLYMPIGMSFNDGLTFDQVQLSNLVSAGQGAVDSNNSAGGAVGEAIVDYGRGLISDAASQGGTTGGIAAQTIKNQGFIRNPRTELLFKGPAIRQFSMTFKLMPSSGKESNEIENIIRTIRSHAYPTLGQNGSTFNFPDTFTIEFLSINGSSLRMMKIADAYCTAVATNFNPTSPAFFDDGSPSEVDLSLTFQETKVITRRDVEAGY